MSMPSKKKKYNARFPAGRIKKIMQTDEEVGKVAQAVPVIISRTLELFVESLLTKSTQITQARNAKTLTPSHMKQCILSESRFDFLKDLVKNIPDASAQEDNENNAIFEASQNSDDPEAAYLDDDSSPASPVAEAPLLAADQPSSSSSSSSGNRTPVIRYGPRVAQERAPRGTPPSKKSRQEAAVLPVPRLVPASSSEGPRAAAQAPDDTDDVPPLVPITPNNLYLHTSGDNLCIDEDYDN